MHVLHFLSTFEPTSYALSKRLFHLEFSLFPMFVVSLMHEFECLEIVAYPSLENIRLGQKQPLAQIRPKVRIL